MLLFSFWITVAWSHWWTKWQFIKIHVATSRLSHANVYISMRPLVLLKFTCLRLSSVRYCICPCINNHTPVVRKTWSEFNVGARRQRCRSVCGHVSNKRRKEGSTDLFPEIFSPQKSQFWSPVIFKGILCGSEREREISLQCSFRPIHIEMSEERVENTQLLEMLPLTFETSDSCRKLTAFVCVARKRILEFTPAWLPVLVGRPVGVECSQSKVKSPSINNVQHTFTTK